MRYLLLAVLFFCRLFPAYGDGDQYVEGDHILEDDQNMEFSYCYPEDSTGTTFSLAKNSGKVFLLEMSVHIVLTFINFFNLLFEISTEVTLWLFAKSFAITPPINPAPKIMTLDIILLLSL